MPLYEYSCRTCECEFEVLRRMSDDSEQPCPECGAVAERRISAPGRMRKSAPAPTCAPADCRRAAGG